MIEYAGITGGKELSEGPFVVSLDRLCCRAHFVVRMRFANFIHEVLGDGGSACRDDVKLDRVRSFKEVTETHSWAVRLVWMLWRVWRVDRLEGNGVRCESNSSHLLSNSFAGVYKCQI